MNGEHNPSDAAALRENHLRLLLAALAMIRDGVPDSAITPAEAKDFADAVNLAFQPPPPARESELREALEPLAAFARQVSAIQERVPTWPQPADDKVIARQSGSGYGSIPEARLTFGDSRRALAALARSPTPATPPSAGGEGLFIRNEAGEFVPIAFERAAALSTTADAPPVSGGAAGGIRAALTKALAMSLDKPAPGGFPEYLSSAVDAVVAVLQETDRHAC